MDKISFTYIKGRRMTTSVIIASQYSLTPKEVLCHIEQIPCSLEFRKSNFELSAYLDKNQLMQPMFEITKDGFLLMVEVYKDYKVDEVKEQFISEFEKGEFVILKHYDETLEMAKAILAKENNT